MRIQFASFLVRPVPISRRSVGRLLSYDRVRISLHVVAAWGGLYMGPFIHTSADVPKRR
jgi:hypothetical protein